jgi:hypothetical protein
VVNSYALPCSLRLLQMFERDDILMAIVLGLGFLAPTSIDGNYSLALLGITLSVLLALVAVLYWQHGCRTSVLVTVSLPIMIILSACTLSSSTFRFGWGVFAQFNLLALVYALDLRRIRPGPFVGATFKIVNVLYIVWGFGIILGSDFIGQFTIRWYAQFYEELLPAMLGLHKPILAFGTHSLAGFFAYLLFWLNWQSYNVARSRLALAFSICYVGLLLALTSFTSLALAAVALIQIAVCLWKRSRRLLVLGVLGLCAILFLAAGTLADQADRFRAEAPYAAAALLNSDKSGPLARYGKQGDLKESISFLLEHPLSPVGYTNPPFLFFADSGPLEYTLRGSVPFLCLVYSGLYVFLRYNSPSGKYALTLFLVVLAFELGFVSLTYFRTLLLLPFLAIYPKYITATNP